MFLVVASAVLAKMMLRTIAKSHNENATFQEPVMRSIQLLLFDTAARDVGRGLVGECVMYVLMDQLENHTVSLMWGAGRRCGLLWEGGCGLYNTSMVWQSDFQETSWCVRINQA